MTSGLHEHRPGPAAQRAVLAAARMWLRWQADAAEDWLTVAIITHMRPSRVDPDERDCILHARDAHYTAARNGTHCLGGHPVLDFPAVRFGGPWDAAAAGELARRVRAWHGRAGPDDDGPAPVPAVTP
jgi:hypothetical protein